MKENLFYKAYAGRQAAFLNKVLALISSIASLPRLFLEVFLRKNLGVRYFSIASALTIVFILGVWPLLVLYGFFKAAPIPNGGNYNGYYGGYQGGPQDIETGSLVNLCTYFGFIILFMILSFFRAKETIKPGGTFDTGVFTYYSGDILPFFFKLPFFKNKPTIRQIEIIYEPALCFIVGLLLRYAGQNIGIIIIVCSIIYSLANWNDYRIGDNYLYDIFDKDMMAKDLINTFSADDEPSTPKGMRLRVSKPNGKEMRRTIAQSIVAPQDDFVIAR